MKAFAMTTTATKLAAGGMKLRLENPANVFSPGRGCESPPYVLPDKIGGYITLVEYGEPICNEGCATPKSCGGCGCGGGCKPAAPKCETGPVMPGVAPLRRYEEIAYSGYDSDDQTLLLTKRSVDGLTEQEWPAGTLVLQSGAAAYISALERLGCLMAIKKATACTAVKAGEWVADPDCLCWRRAKKDVAITVNDNGVVDFPTPGAPETAEWSKCYMVNDLLDVLEDPGYMLKDGCTGAALPDGAAVVSRAHPVDPGEIIIPGKGTGNGDLAVVAGTVIKPDYSKLEITTGIGRNLAHPEGDALIIDVGGSYTPDLDLGIVHKAGTSPAEFSAYSLQIFINGQPGPKTEVSMAGTRVTTGINSGEDSDKDVKALILPVGTKVEWIAKLITGDGGHFVSRLPVKLKYNGCSVKTYP